MSPNGVFSAGFHAVGDHAFCFAIWFTISNQSIVWMANRDYTVNGKRSELKLVDSGNLILMDAGKTGICSTNTVTASPVQLRLLDSGNLVLQAPSKGVILWRSFDFPTDILLPNQPITREVNLISSRSATNYSSGNYKLFLYTDNILKLLYDGPVISSLYWPDPNLLSWDNDRTTAEQKLALDFDGNLRMYSLRENGEWAVTWQALAEQCLVHGVCGPNSLCESVLDSGRNCTCLPGFRLKNSADLAEGYVPEFDLPSDNRDVNSTFSRDVDYGYLANSTYDQRSQLCLESDESCKGFLLKYIDDYDKYNCHPKTRLLNGNMGILCGRKARLLVFLFMEQRSLAENLHSNFLNWEKRYEIALGTAKGLAYIHEECMKWVLHCAVKPQNILLDSTWHPKVADFGLSKLLNSDAIHNSIVSKVRGTRGYMAPEWVSNMSSTSKVDVYSFAVIMLEIKTGKSPVTFQVEAGLQQHTLVTWAREKKNQTPTAESWIEEIADQRLMGYYNMDEMKTLALVALQCVSDDKDKRPTMSLVVEMLQKHKNVSLYFD
ncbi:hypothetical protein Ancab_016450 [Ancistrocladus abbreviatus]